MEDASSKKELEEDHTREIEIENAFKTFQEAITLLESNQLADAYVKFKDLSHKDVILNHYYEETAFMKGLQNGGLNTQPDELSFISQKVKSIRFLYFRNRGFLYFNILRSDPETKKLVFEADASISGPQTSPTTEADFSRELFYSMMDDLANSVSYQEADEQLLRLLYDLYVYMDVKKLARYTLEYAHSVNTESDDIMSLLPLNDWADDLWIKFEKTGLTEESISPRLAERFLFLKPIKDDLQRLIFNKLEKNTLEVAVKESPNWLDVIQSLNLALRAGLDKEKVAETIKCGLRHVNPYSLTESSIDRVKFVFANVENDETDQMEVDVIEGVQEEEKESIKGEEEVEIQETKSVEDTKTDTPVISPLVVTVPTTLAEKVIHRSSRRLKPEDAAPYEPDDIQLTRHYYVETEGFFGQINKFLTEIFSHEPPALKDVVAYIVDDPDETTPQYIQDFVMALNDWDRKVYTPIMITDKATLSNNASSKTDGEKLKLMDVLTQFGNLFVSETDVITESLDDLEAPEITTILARTSGKHVNELKITLLFHLIGDSERNILLEYQWSTPLFCAVREWVLQLEAEIMNLFELKIETPDDVDRNIQFIISIYEILVDLYIETKSEIDKFFESLPRGKSKAGLNASSLELIRLDERITKWQNLITYKVLNVFPVKELAQHHFACIIRYYWASNYRLAARSFSWKEKKLVVQDLLELADFLKISRYDTLKISLPNFANLGDFSKETLHRRLSTSSILSIFSKILYNDDHQLDGSEDTIELLESILIKNDESDVSMDNSQLDVNTLVESVINGKATLDKNSLRSVQDFLDECPIDLKLSLWNILFLYYEDNSSFENFQKGLEQYLDFALEYWASFRYRDNKNNRILSFLVSLNFFRSYLRIFLRYLAEHKWELPYRVSNDQTDVILNFARIFEICYVFSLHEEAALITGNKISLGYRSEAAFTTFKDFCIESMTIMLVYCVTDIRRNKLDDADSLITKILRLVHQQLGLRRLCDASNGTFLRFSEFTLVGLQNKPNVELAQLLSCRFHFKVKASDMYPVDHYTTKVSTLDKSSAIELAAFVLPPCFRENPILKVPRNDMKQVLDDLMEVIGDPDIEGSSSLLHNNATLEKFIDTSTLTARFIKECFYGLTTIDFIKPENDSSAAIDGLYFLQAVTMFNSYKIRKKSAQSRTVELERIIRLLKDDLMYCSNRMESWLLLGQAYGYIVEDDLIWTSDKLNIIDRKVVTANLQRKSLVCYIMAINTLTQQGPTDNESTNSVIGILMNSFVKELYGAVQTPMEMIAFKVRDTYKFVRKRNQTMFQTVSDKPTVPIKFCFKLLLRCLQIAIKSNPNEWSSYYYLGKVMSKLNKKPEEVIECLLLSCKLCQAQGTTADPLLEASYKVVTLLYKYVKENKLSVEAAISYLKQEPLLNMQLEGEFPDKLLFYKAIISILQKLISLDKKAWYHKPCYRMALIEYDEFDDYKKAREIMNKFFSLKASNKTFLQMWKPENERPGKHFVYMFQYTQFYIKMLRRELDLSSLIQILPKLRKANSTMVLLYFAWENITSSICKLIRVIAQVEDNFVEMFLLKHSHSSFMTDAKSVVEKVKECGIPDEQKPLFCYLQVVNEMRKLNNGFGPTSLIDDTICAIFVKIFNGTSKPEKVQETIDLTVRFKKLAKRDLFPFANELVTRCKRDVDMLLKDEPELFNSYVAKYIEHKRNLSMQLFNPSPAENAQSLNNNDASRVNNETTNGRPGLLSLSMSMDTEPSNSQPGVDNGISQLIPTEQTGTQLRNQTNALKDEEVKNLHDKNSIGVTNVEQVANVSPLTTSPLPPSKIADETLASPTVPGVPEVVVQPVGPQLSEQLEDAALATTEPSSKSTNGTEKLKGTLEPKIPELPTHETPESSNGNDSINQSVPLHDTPFQPSSETIIISSPAETSEPENKVGSDSNANKINQQVDKVASNLGLKDTYIEGDFEGSTEGLTDGNESDININDYIDVESDSNFGTNQAEASFESIDVDNNDKDASGVIDPEQVGSKAQPQIEGLETKKPSNANTSASSNSELTPTNSVRVEVEIISEGEDGDITIYADAVDTTQNAEDAPVSVSAGKKRKSVSEPSISKRRTRSGK